MAGDVVGRAQYDLTADATGVTKGTAAAEKQIKSTGATAEKAFGQQATGALGKLKASMANISKGGGIGGAMLGGMGIGAGLGVFGLVTQGLGMVTDFLGDAGRAASDLNETQSKLNAVFKTSAGTITEWSKSSAQAMGLSQQATLEAVGTFGNFLQAMGQAEPAAADMSMAMVQLATDLGSFNNEDPTEVLDALRSGLSGETEPLRRFGVDISDAAVSASLLADGVKKVGGQFTQGQKIAARYKLIIQQTNTAQGDFARTSDGTANKTKILASEMENAKAKAGALVNSITNAAIGLGTDLVGALGNVVDAFEVRHDPAMQAATDYINAYGRAVDVAIVKTKALDEAIAPDPVAIYAQAWQQYLDYNGDVIAQLDVTGQTMDWLRTISLDLTRSTGLGADAFMTLANNVIATGGTFDDFVIAIQRLREMQLGLVGTLYQVNKEGTSLGGVVTGIGTAADGAKPPVGDLTAALAKSAAMSAAWTASLPQDVSHAVVGMKAAVKSGKAGIIEQFRDLAYQTKHPWVQKNYEDWLRERLAAAMRKMKAAEKAGHPGLVEQYRQLASDIKAELEGLPGYAATVHADLLSALGGAINAAVTRDYGNPKKPKHKALGGRVDAFTPYIVGDGGRAELFVPDRSGTILPSVPSRSVVEHRHTITLEGARNLRIAGYDEQGVAGFLRNMRGRGGLPVGVTG